MDWEGIKQIAFGALNLSHDELGKLTHGEFLELCEGFKWRDEKDRAYLALQARVIMSAQSKKPLNPFKEFKLTKTHEKKKTTPEESKQVVNDLMEKMGVKNNG
jgi:hypothetical protein